MKYSKVAAVMAGSVMAVGIAGPAFADAVHTGSATAPPTSLTGGVNELTSQQPLQKIGDNAPVAPLLDTVGQLGKAAGQLRNGVPTHELVGQGTDAVRSAAMPTVLGAVPGASLLGGLPLGGLGGG